MGAVPKINVYLPDDLANAVRDARIPVSAVCQRALEDALRQTTAAAEATRTFDDAADASITLPSVATARLREAVHLGFGEARDRRVSFVGTEHLMLGVLDQGGNLAVTVIEALDVRADDVRRELDAVIAQHEPQRAASNDVPVMTPLARRAFDIASEEALRLGHNYLGCEHLLLGLLGEDEGIAGRVLRSMGIDRTVTRRAVVTALSGFVVGRNQASATPSATTTTNVEPLLRDVLDRLERLERRLAS
ncbi:MAG: ATPase with chaperone ATP-binding subunit-like protein [Actinomycetia bacterium]|nr:ATPase with chaperone ATP-binding subunit-like protein [Actinomycetes bacterium]